jgi:putative DNA primase/helicase
MAQDLERNLRSGDLHPALASHLAKYRKLVPTLALINHLADAGHGLIGKDAMMRALGLATYLETHAKRAYGAGPEAETCRGQGNPHPYSEGQSCRRLYRKGGAPAGWSNLSDRGQVQAGLDLLCDLDWIVAVETGNHGRGRPTTHYRINPRAVR